MTYEDALAALDRQELKGPEPGSDIEIEALERFKRVFGRFERDQIGEAVDAAYAETLFFNDTLKTIETRARLREYLIETAKRVENCQVEVLDVVRYGEDFYVRWKMMIAARRMNGGLPTFSFGISHLRFDASGQVVLHQDYWDAASGLFQHLPIIGGLLRWIKRRL